MAFKKLKYWFDEELAKLLSDKIIEVVPDFQANSFISAVKEKVGPLELKDRVEIIADELFLQLDQDYKTGINSLLQILGPENQEETGMFTNYYWVMPIAKYVEKYGQDHFKLSMQAIEEITKRNTGEYTIRPYIVNDQKKTIATMKKWSKHPNLHIRRLSSEGLRPRLPWAKKLDTFIDDPRPILPILNNLKDDPSKYVQKSVANCLNDILKDNLSIGQEVLGEWSETKVTAQRKWIIRHALRNHLKRNDRWAINLMKNI